MKRRATHWPTRARVVGGVERFRDDSLYPKVASAVETLPGRGKIVAPIDFLIAMGLLTAAQVEGWPRVRVMRWV